MSDIPLAAIADPKLRTPEQAQAAIEEAARRLLSVHNPNIAWDTFPKTAQDTFRWQAVHLVHLQDLAKAYGEARENYGIVYADESTGILEDGLTQLNEARKVQDAAWSALVEEMEKVLA